MEFHWIQLDFQRKYIFRPNKEKVRTFETAFKSIAESRYTAPINASKQLGMIGGTSNMKFFLSRKYNWTNKKKINSIANESYFFNGKRKRLFAYQENVDNKKRSIRIKKLFDKNSRKYK